jgi:UDP-4-amino-4-deoxy-L-arabinose formyltransferase/UDP-glucuronic acid dehydrogenase (UDP-4-keto-hexauronic acid decarboxylating)
MGRSAFLADIAYALLDKGHIVTGVITAKESAHDTFSVNDWKYLCRKLALPLLVTSKAVRHESEIKSWESDIAVSVNFPTVISATTIDLFPNGILNVHGGDLPKYRGNACQAWAIINGEDSVALCVHKMIGGQLDTGPIIARSRLRIGLDTKVTEILEWMRGETPGLVLKSLQELEDNPHYFLELPSEDPTDSLRCYARRPEDGQIDWRSDPETIIRLVNAHNRPYAGAFTYLEQERLIIWDAQLENDNENFLAVPGQVTWVSQGHITVACGTGKIRILQVEVDGKVATPDFFVSSVRQRPGNQGWDN